MIGKYTKSKTIHCNLIGIYTANAYIPNTAIIIHTPRSCSHIVYSATAMLKERYLRSAQLLPYCSDNLFVTCMDDNDAIFGGELRLEECIRDVIEVKQPEYVMVVGGCVAGVIGDDIDSVCRKVELDTGVPIFYINGAGFMSDEEDDPYIKTTELLIDRFMEMRPRSEVLDSVVILGELAVNNKKSVMENIDRFFSYFGFKQVLYPIGGMKPGDFNQLNRVAVAVAGKGQLNKKKRIHEYTRSFAEKMDIPYMLEDLPETPIEIRNYVKLLTEKMGKPEMATEILLQEESLLEQTKKACAPQLEGKSCVLAFMYSYSYAFPERLIETVQASGLAIKGFLLLPEMADVEKALYKKNLAKYNVPIMTEEEYLVSPLKEELVISSFEKPYFPKEFLTMAKHVGAAGICSFWQQLRDFVASDRRMGHEE